MPDNIEVALRSAHIGASAVLFGLLVYPLYARRSGVGRRFEILLAAVALSTSLAWVLWMAATLAPGALTDAGLLSTVFLRTSFGPMWLIHIGLGAATLGAVSIAAPRFRPAVASVSAVHLSSLALIGHSAAQEGPGGLVLMGAHAAHVLAAGVWMGGVLALFIALQRREAGFTETVRRFSMAGYAAVALLLTAGFVNLAMVAHRWLPDPGTAYGFAALLKIGLATALLAVAGFNRLHASRSGWERIFAASLALEMLLFLATLVIAGCLSGLDPHPHAGMTME